MIIKRSAYWLLAPGLLLVQLGVCPIFNVFGVCPDLLLISSVAAGFILPFYRALFYASFAGLLQDAFLLSSFGLNVLIFPFWVIVIRQVTSKITIEDEEPRLLFMLVVCILSSLGSQALAFYSGKSISLGIALRIMLISCIYNLAIFRYFLRACLCAQKQ